MEDVTLMGVGAASPEIKTIARQITPRGVKALVINKSKLSADDQRKWDRGDLKAADGALYIRRNIYGKSGIFEMLDDTIDAVPGVTNITRRRLAGNENYAITRVELNFSPSYDGDSVETTAIKAVAQLLPISSLSAAQMGHLNGALNGELEIVVSGRSILRQPVSRFQEGVPGLSDGPKNGINLTVPEVITNSDDVQVKFFFAKSVAGATSTDTIIADVVLVGNRTRSK